MAILSVLVVLSHPTRNAYFSASRDGSLSQSSGRVHHLRFLAAKTDGTHPEALD
ncbi:MULTISPECIES: hypothetical protein [unclassified Arthrobacter]|uniref:hypothetical protein n=1 Tax=unclassified Arthrobacter TaxID=235627 RepID=UPI001D13D388|nr:MULTISPECIES: hypothetical protein [unclassified Arthrobacter]MCC3289668.1 hypothetical protein [Arthrobacter sp. zg-Y1110]MCC3300816.1 hypothetical protein [Arthrobacter sp. zg-Y895]UWX84910.1 hypothetical protein N2K99_15890 [Arthrobacter sp. zg-Y1110]